LYTGPLNNQNYYWINTAEYCFQGQILIHRNQIPLKGHIRPVSRVFPTLLSRKLVQRRSSDLYLGVIQFETQFYA